MKRLCVLAFAVQVLVVCGCTAVSTSFDYDTGADFSSLRTYTWVSTEHDPAISELVLARVEDSVRDVLDAKGYRRVPTNPDFRIHAHLSRHERTEITEVGERYDERGWRATHLEVNNYEEGTLVLDVETPAAGTLIWRGVASRAINPRWTPAQITERVREAVELVLDEFPPPG